MADPFQVCSLAKDPQECHDLLTELVSNIDDIDQEQLDIIMKKLVGVTGLSPKVLTESLGVHCDCVK